MNTARGEKTNPRCHPIRSIRSLMHSKCIVRYNGRPPSKPTANSVRPRKPIRRTTLRRNHTACGSLYQSTRPITILSHRFTLIILSFTRFVNRLFEIFTFYFGSRKRGRICLPLIISVNASGIISISATKEWGFPMGSSCLSGTK